MSTALGQLLIQLRGSESLRDVSGRAGISHNYLRQLEIGFDPRTNKEIQPTSSAILKLSRVYNYPYKDLLEIAGIINPADIQNLEVLPMDALTKIPLLGTIRAGEPLYVDQNVLEWVEVSVKDTQNGEFFYLRVTGDSMKDSHILDGGRVLVRRQNHADSGDIIVALTNGDEATVKKIKFDNGKTILIPANSNYDPKVYDNDEVQIIGRVMRSEVMF